MCFVFAVTQCAVVVNNRAIQLQTAYYQDWQYCDIARPLWDLFDTSIETLVFTILIEASKELHNTIHSEYNY